MVFCIAFSRVIVQTIKTRLRACVRTIMLPTKISYDQDVHTISNIDGLILP